HNANQLIAQAELVKAIVSEIYQNKKETNSNAESIRNLDKRVSCLEKSSGASLNRMPVYEQLAECVTPEQVEEMKARVKAIRKSPMKIWGKFNKHFRISRYRHLPQSKFQEAMEWLQNIEHDPRF
ncbi:MAG: ORF6C domain-containing protein, partial [Candidatus Brocadiae bacterium]|nr:ORF6C domain-containing protein [Candidatus Brocadiia bacterium]